MDGDVEIGSDTIVIGGRVLPLEIRRHSRARRVSVRVDTARHCIVLTLPRGLSEAKGRAFLMEKSVWLRNNLARVPAPVPFVPGAEVPYLGAAHEIRHRPDARGGVWRAEDAFHVTGAIEHLPRRLTDFLKAEAKRECNARARTKAAVIEKPIARVSVRETRSRWGSASSRGNLNFAWRLILAPEFVLDYVVAHEVAHLVEMNHSRRFWELTAELTADAAGARKWLRVHGPGLYRYGVNTAASGG
jgi:predicted metal-dependent hydrolase